MLLKDMKPGEKGIIVQFRPGQIEYRRRLLALGALPGTKFEVARVAPLGDPVEIKLRGSFISVRKGEIGILDVKPLD
ncbi:FeoA family protein [uncultured Parasutterella sp.]|uniref:FeoA family protein n=1 Tax=uncultured Parasutterella sp. TaxID=1263098 RepID=UPI0025967BFB|nr:FeoA family protein [uncultured Parasutterella sp.]